MKKIIGIFLLFFVFSSFTVADAIGTPCSQRAQNAYDQVLGQGASDEMAEAVFYGVYESCCEDTYGSSCLQP